MEITILLKIGDSLDFLTIGSKVAWDQKEPVFTAIFGINDETYELYLMDIFNSRCYLLTEKLENGVLMEIPSVGALTLKNPKNNSFKILANFS